jgi:very-short-patch-repair endonuclease
MRLGATDAERRIWSRLRQRRLGGWKFRRQHPVCGFIVDFYCADTRLAVELDGGGHAMPEKVAYDQQRDRVLTQNGVCVLRFWDDEALKETDAVLEIISKALQAPHPSLSPEGRGLATPSQARRRS